GCEEGITGTGGKNNHVAATQMTDRRTAVVVFHHATHRNRGHHAGGDAGALHGIAHGQRVHHGCKHSHVVASHPFHASCMQCCATEQVTTANYHADLDTQSHQLADFYSHAVQDLGINTKVGIPHQRLTTQLQQYAFILFFSFCHDEPAGSL